MAPGKNTVSTKDSEKLHQMRKSNDREALKKGVDGRVARTAADFITLLLKKRLLSSPDAFWKTINTHAETIRGEEPRLVTAIPTRPPPGAASLRRSTASSSTLR